MIKIGYNGEPIGHNAIYEWNGTGDIVQTQPEITSTAPSINVQINLNVANSRERIVELSLDARIAMRNNPDTLFGYNPRTSNQIGMVIDITA